MRIALVIALVSIAAACSSHRLEKPRQGTLSERVEGQEGIEKIVEALAANVAEDPRLKERFANVDMKVFKANMTTFLCKTVGADCKYDKAMTAVHAGMNISEGEFEAFMEVFIVSMNDAELPQKEQNDLIDAMLGMQDQVVAQ